MTLLGARHQARHVTCIISLNLHDSPMEGFFTCLSDEKTHSETLIAQWNSSPHVLNSNIYAFPTQ